MANIGGLGGLGGYDIGDILGAVGQSLLTSPRTAPLAGLPAAIQARNKQSDEEMARGATEMALTKLGIDPATAKVMSRNPQAAALWVTGDNAAKGRAMGAEAMKGFGAYTLPGEEPTAPAPASPSPGAPAQKVGSLGGLGGMQPAAGGAGGPYAGAVSGIESGGRYDALGPVTKTGDRAYGRFQVMGANIPSWTQEVLGRSLTPQEFLNSQEAQDAVFKAKFGQYAAKYGPEGAARAWFAGEGGMNDLGRRDQLGTSVGDYGKRFMAGLGGQPAQAPAAP
ncbi:MAG TPA: hypothetical protein PKD06_18200, partial [Enterovirga sp.]|nr:hypothetical protein [Enterovirga sp.]